MTELLYLKDSYRQTCESTVISVEKHGNLWEIILNQTVFYPVGGGQPSDKGTITTKSAKANVKHVRLKNDTVIHECVIEGELTVGNTVTCTIDWPLRLYNMRVHSAGHIVHEATKIVAPHLIPLKGEHGDHAYITYQGTLTADHANAIEKKANDIISQDVSLTTEFVTREELEKRSSWVPEHLPTNKPLRILTVGDFSPIPDGGTQVAKSSQVGPITIDQITNENEAVNVYYNIEAAPKQREENADLAIFFSSAQLIGTLLSAKNDAIETIKQSDKPTDLLRIDVLGPKSDFANFTKQMKSIAPNDRQAVGVVINEVKNAIEEALQDKSSVVSQQSSDNNWIDESQPGIRPPEGHLHIVTQAIMEITDIFNKIGFTRVRHPEVDWDYYAFESLNMPANHPARDEWETFFIKSQITKPKSQKGGNPKFNNIVLTPHTSNGQVREMEKGNLPIRMINIAKCYRRQEDVSHTTMFHQFEGLFIDKNVSIGNLKGVMDFFFTQYYGPNRVSRIRPFHFQFTEPSFEVDVSCGACDGKARLPDGQSCRLCKEGWLELGGAGMVHPNVLKAGGINPDIYNGFAFGWGIERVAIMKIQGMNDNRQVYNNDIRFLEQF